MKGLWVEERRGRSRRKGSLNIRGIGRWKLAERAHGSEKKECCLVGPALKANKIFPFWEKNGDRSLITG